MFALPPSAKSGHRMPRGFYLRVSKKTPASSAGASGISNRRGVDSLNTHQQSYARFAWSCGGSFIFSSARSRIIISRFVGSVSVLSSA
jgi:hypothetical protein